MNDFELYKQKLDEALVISKEYYSQISDINSVAATKIGGVEPISSFLRVFKQFVDLYYLAYQPLQDFYSVKFRYNSIEIIQKHLNDSDDSVIDQYYTAGEIYDCLTKISPSSARYIIGRMSKSSSDFENLYDYYLAGDKPQFVNYLKAHECDTKQIYGVCALIADLVPEIANKALEQYRDDPEALDAAQGRAWKKWGAKWGATKDQMTIKDNFSALWREGYHLLCEILSILMEHLTDFSEEICNDLVSKVISCTDAFQRLTIATANRIKSDYFMYCSHDKKLCQIEKQFIAAIKSRPEVSEYFSRWDQEYPEYLASKESHNKAAEEQPEAQNAQQGPVTAPSEDVKKQVAQTKEDSTDASLDGKEETSQKQFNVPKNYMDLPSYSDMDDYYSAMNPKLSSLGADGMTRVFEMLDTYGFLKGEKDQQLLFYRLTGRCRPIEQGELEPINWISHNGHCKELMYFLKRILPDGDKQKYAKARLFFNKFKKWPDTINITTSQYAEGAKASFRKDLHKINPKIFRYSSKGKDEKKPEKKLEKK